MPFGYLLTSAHRRLNHAVRKLEQAASSENPAKLFGHDSPGLLARTFTLGRRFNPRKQIHVHLVGVIKEAGELIRSAFPELRKTVHDRETGPTIGEMIAGRPRYDDHWDGYIAYVDSPADLPFEPVDTESPTAALDIVARIDITPASSQWLRAVASATKRYDEEAEAEARGLGALEVADDVEEALNMDSDNKNKDHDEGSDASSKSTSVSEGREEEVQIAL